MSNWTRGGKGSRESEGNGGEQSGAAYGRGKVQQMTNEQKQIVFQELRQLRDRRHFAAVTFASAYVRVWYFASQRNAATLSWNEAARMIGRPDLATDPRSRQPIRRTEAQPWEARRAEYLMEVERMEVV
jgi:hypothetical protein